MGRDVMPKSKLITDGIETNLGKLCKNKRDGILVIRSNKPPPGKKVEGMVSDECRTQTPEINNFRKIINQNKQQLIQISPNLVQEV